MNTNHLGPIAAAEAASRAGWYLVTDETLLLAVNPNRIGEVWTYSTSDDAWLRNNTDQGMRVERKTLPLAK